MTTKLTTLDLAKELAKVGNDDFNDRLQTLIGVVSSDIMQYCRRDFVKLARTEYFDAPDQQFDRGVKIWVKETPIDLSATFEIRYNRYRDWSDTTPLENIANQPDLYTVDVDKGLIILHLNTWKAPRSIQVTYTGGYDLDGDLLASPIDLSYACAAQVAFEFDREINNEIGRTDEKAKGADAKVLASAIGGFSPEAMKRLKGYKKLLVGRHG